MKPPSLEALLKCFVSAKSNSFENLLDPFLKMFRLSTGITIGVAKSQFFKRIIDKLSHSKAVVRLNLLRILRTVCEAHPNRAMLVERFGIYDIVSKLSQEDGAVLVRELAREIVPSLAPALKPISSRSSRNPETPRGTKSALAPKRVRRTASESLAGSPATVVNSNLRATSRKATGTGRSSTRQKLNEIPWQPGVDRG